MGNVIFSLSAAAILIVGFVYWLLVVVPAIRARNRAILMPAVLPVAVVVLWLGGTGVLAVATNHIRPGNYRHITAQGPHTAGGWVLLAIYALFTVACVTVCTASTRRPPTPLAHGPARRVGTGGNGPCYTDRVPSSGRATPSPCPTA